MRRNTNVVLACLGLLLGTAGCDSFLTGNKLTNNPNLPTEASIRQLFVGVQAGQFAFQEGTVAMMMCEWVQSCSAANGRFVQQAGQYFFGEGSNIAANNGDWISVYDGGGLIDIKQVEAKATASNDRKWLGAAKVWEAFTVGTASAMWGDIPYTEAVSGNTAPALDNRFAILAALQTLLTGAIADLGSGVGSGPGDADLVFGGDTTKWIRAAWTLKARYYIETAESLGAPAYTAAIAAALNGINDATGASDFSSFHTLNPSERNMWAQFQLSSGFGTDLEAGKALVDYMNARTDPRRAQYFCLNSLGGYGGDDFNVAVPAGSVSQFLCSPMPARFAENGRVPYVTYAENELILAEAYAQTGDEPSARTHLNNAYAAVPGLASTAGAATGAALMDSIMLEKWVSLFQNIESISDYRRTCIPNITPSRNSAGFTKVPGRLFYPQNERNVNTNIPDGSTQLATHGFRNAGDVNPCGPNAPP
jgi:hypothetical protein